MLLWLIAGIAIGYLFRPQIYNGIQKVKKLIQDNNSSGRGY
jgi:hypothetical protein